MYRIAWPIVVLVAMALAYGCVTTTDPGVPEAERERIFEPFYRREGRREDRDDDRGVGLGLSLVRQIARRHGGDARCLPREGGGACLEVRLLTKLS